MDAAGLPAQIMLQLAFLYIYLQAWRALNILHIAVAVNRFVASDARDKATKGEPVAASAGILRVDEVGSEGQVVAIGGIRQTS